MLNCGCRDPCWAREGREGVWWALSGGFPGVYSLGGAVSGRPKSLEAIPKVPKKLPIKTLARSFGGGGQPVPYLPWLCWLWRSSWCLLVPAGPAITLPSSVLWAASVPVRLQSEQGFQQPAYHHQLPVPFINYLPVLFLFSAPNWSTLPLSMSFLFIG